MKVNNTFQDRYLLSLCFDDESKIIKSILKSPLGLVKEINRLLFENDFDSVKNNLDSIKQFVAGINRSENIGKTYSLGKYYPSLFSFHQFVHSSYRARQGKTLEVLFKVIIRQSNEKIVVPNIEKEKRNLMSEVFKDYSSKLDIDVVARKSKGNVLVLQLRSRDDTGGTTAKSSLVEVLRNVMNQDVIKKSNLLYLIGIWDVRQSNQKNITIDKIYESLLPYFREKLSKNDFSDNIENGISLFDGVVLKLSYGVENIVESVSNWVGEDTKLDYSSMKNIIMSLEKSDDFWLSYVIASHELKNIKLKGINNIKYLDELLSNESFDISNFNSNEDYLDLANSLTLRIIPKWENDSLPVSSVSEKIHYIRDLILLRFVYEVS